jgi:O-antigen/teichoic acid export membrane protein
MKEEKKLFSNAFYLFLDIFFVNLFSLLYTLTIWKFLPPKDYGIIATVTNLSLLFATFSCVGFTTANPKLISEYFKKRQFKKISALIKFSFSVSLVLSIAFSLTIFFIYSLFPNIFNLSSDAILMVCILICLIVIHGLLASLLHGLQNMRKYFLTDFAGYGTKAFLTFLFLSFGFGYIGALISLALCYFIIILLRFEKEWFSLAGEIDKKFVFYNYALSAFFIIIFSLFINNSQYVILNFLKGPEITGIFGTALTISFVITLIPNILSASLFPIISELSAEKRKKSKQSYLTNVVVRYILLFSLPAILFFLIFSREIVLFFSGKEYLASAPFLYLVVPASFLFGFGNFLLTCLYGIRKTALTRNISLSFTFIFLISTLPLTYFFSAWGLSVVYFVNMLFYFSVTFIFVKKFLKVKGIAKSFIKILFASAIFGILLFSSEIFALKLYLKILILLIAGLFYFILLIPLRFYQHEEVRILNYLGKRAPVFKNIFFSLANFLSKYVS